MPMNILMPALSPTMEKGTLAKWLVKEGDTVNPGQVIAEIETDKATMEYESADAGVVGRIAIPAGTEDVAVGTLIAVLLEEGEKPDSTPSQTPAPAKRPPAPAPTPATMKPASVLPAPAPQIADSPPPAAPVVRDGDRIIASPLARRIAAQSGIDLARIKGTGPGGRIVKADLDQRSGAGAVSASVDAPLAPSPVAAAVATTDIPHVETKLSNMRKTIARRLTESKQSIPHIYLTVDCTLDTLLKVRKDLNAKLEAQGIKLSINDFVIRAAALALKKVPAANVQYAGDMLRTFSRVDISVAVAIPNGLITPIIMDAANKGLGQIATEMNDLAERAKAGKLQPAEYQGGTFSISNMGMMGIKDFCAVINPPQAGILAIGAGEQRAVVRDGALAIATIMSVTGSFDHRVIDGADGAAFLTAFKALIEDPILMLA